MPGLNQHETIADGYMNLIENIGKEGILVVFGGNTYPVSVQFATIYGRRA